MKHITAQYMRNKPFRNANEAFWLNAFAMSTKEFQPRVGDGSLRSFIGFWNKRLGRRGINKTMFFWDMVRAGKIKVIKVYPPVSPSEKRIITELGITIADNQRKEA